MVVKPIASPVVLDQRQIEIPAPHLGLPLFQGFDRARTECHGCQARRGSDAFLTAGEDRIDFPAVGFDGQAAQRCNAVEREQGAFLMCDLRDLFDRLPGTRRGLSMHHADDLRPRAPDRRLHLIGIEHFAKRPFDHRQLGSRPVGHLFHPGAEETADADEHLVAGLDQVVNDGFHAGRPRAGNRQSQGIRGLEHVPEQILRLVHERDEVGVQGAPEAACSSPRARAEEFRRALDQEARGWGFSAAQAREASEWLAWGCPSQAVRGRLASRPSTTNN